MAITFDPASLRIVLDSADVSAAEIFSRWEDWVATSDNSKYLPAFRHAGGDDLGGGLSIPNYMFLINGWRVRPMESNHSLVITGNLFVDGGGVPVVQTLGSYNVSAQYTVPVQAQAFDSGGSGGPSAGAIAAAVVAALQATEIPVNIKKVNDVAIKGAGVSPTFDETGAVIDEGNPWLPA